MNKPHILVQYHGGGYDGCIWEWNYCLVDDFENPTVFKCIAASGCSGIKTLEDYKKSDDIEGAFTYDLNDQDAWREFDHEANPAHVFGVANWLENNTDYSMPVYCDTCDTPIDDIYFGEYAGEGGISYAPHSKTCYACAVALAWEYTKPELLSDLDDNGIEFDDLDDQDVETILYYTMDKTGADWENDGDSMYLYNQDRIVEYITEHAKTIRYDALCQDNQLLIKF